MAAGGLEAAVAPLDIVLELTIFGTIVPVPEPSTMVLLGTGFAGLAIVARRKRAKAAQG